MKQRMERVEALEANAIDVAFISPSARAALRAGYEGALAVP